MEQKDFQKLYEEYNGKISDMNIKNEFDMFLKSATIIQYTIKGRFMSR